jgi:Ca2+-binding EF-hand superfamily protein
MSRTKKKARAEKKSETLELRIGWTEKQAFMEKCEAEGVAASAQLRMLIQSHLSEQAEHVLPITERMPPMNRMFKKRPRSAFAALVATAGAAVMAAATPSMANVDTEAAFNLIDANRDGQIVFEEFYQHAADEGFFMAPNTPANVPERMASEREITGALRSEFARYDRNRDGILTHGEFAGRYVWRLETSFNAIDRDSDGRIETRELARVMGSIGLDETNARLSREGRADQAIRAFDQNSDGALDFDEFTALD